MAHLEEENYEKPCPCGKGTITWTFYSPTAPYQRGMDGPRSLNCDECAKDWVLSSRGPNELRNKMDVAAVEAASQERARARREGTAEERAAADAAYHAANKAVRRFPF